MKPALSTFSSLPDIQVARRELQNSTSYFWDNRKRFPTGTFVLQQTLEGSVFVEDPTGRYVIDSGKAFLFEYGEDSRYGLDAGCQRPYRLLWISFVHTDSLRGLISELRDTFGRVLRMSPTGEAGHLLQRLQDDFAAGNLRDRFVNAERVHRLLIALLREQIEDTRGQDPVSYGRHILQTRFRVPMNLKEWSDELGITREHFSREFHRRYGISPANFLRNLRLDHAKELLNNESLSVAEVAGMSGFASAQTFRRAFRAAYGVPAGQAHRA